MKNSFIVLVLVAFVACQNQGQSEKQVRKIEEETTILPTDRKSVV